MAEAEDGEMPVVVEADVLETLCFLSDPAFEFRDHRLDLGLRSGTKVDSLAGLDGGGAGEGDQDFGFLGSGCHLIHFLRLLEELGGYADPGLKPREPFPFDVSVYATPILKCQQFFFEGW